MAKRLLFVILIYFPCKTQCEEPSPQLTVDPPVISAETHSVILNCHHPSSAPVSQCYFIIEGRQFIESYSCWKTLTLTELLAKTGQSSPAEVKVQCFYTVRNGHAYSHSSYSNMASIYIQNPPPQLTLYPPVISAETHSVILNCQPPSSAPVPLCYFIIEGRQFIESSSCQMTLTGTELLVNSGQSSPAEVKVKCFYTVRKGDVNSPSLHSSTQSMYVQSPVEAAPTLTVSARTISETESVTLRCQPPPSVSAPQCYFYTVKGGSPKLWPCVKTLTGSELLLMSQQSSPAEVEVKCFYTVKLGPLDYPSAHSDAQVMMIHSGPPELSAQHFPGEDVVFACSLPGSAIKDTTCNLYFGDGTVQRANLSSRSRMDKKCFCQFSVSVNDLLRLSPQQSHASCDYSLKGDPNTLSPRSERYNLADIVEKESRRAPTQPSLTLTTSKTSSTAKVQWTTSSPTTSVKDIVESQSTRAPSQPSLTQTTSKTSSTVQVQWTPPLLTPSVTNIVEKESSRTSTQPSLTQTTSKTSSTVQGQWRTSSPHTLLKDNIIKIIAGVTLFGVAVGVNFLGWLFIKKESCFNKRTRGNVSNDSIDMEVVDSRRVVPAGKNQSIDAMVPNEVYCSDTKEVDKNSQDNEGEYHVYQTINDVPDQRIQNDMVYSLLQAH